MKRRDFLRNTGIITAGSLLLPSFLRANAFMPGFDALNQKRLIMVQLSGGNDGLNTIVPYGLDEYYQNRAALGLKADGLIRIDDKFGFNPALGKFNELLDKGWISIINSVGYPNPNRSHFRSMDIWHTASDTNEYLSEGWIGRYLDSNCEHPYEAIEINGKLSLALKGEQRSGIALTHPKAFYDTINAPFFNELTIPDTENAELNYMYKVFNETRSSAKYIYDQHKLKPNNSEYGGERFGQNLKQIATLIKSDIATPVFYTELSGFDTHVNQNATQSRLLKNLNDGIGSFINDLEKDDLMKECTIVVFSEFGRRLKENASRGTDHGAANVLFVIDKNLSTNAMSYNAIDLQDLNDGDPKYKVDFRSVYQDVLNKTLNVDPKSVLGKSYDELNLFK
ncbi:MAG: DUF1501 domain-containing protein [Crocinitomicaceae bacterium]|nr:DUF1501 domain-containing protein [Crocinitomicaceae bacterium]